MADKCEQCGKSTKDSAGDAGWMHNRWRPYMAVQYMAVCLFDFIIGPIFWSLIQIIGHGSVDTPWTSLTLVGGGLYHLAMGAVLGITAWTRGTEKVEQIRTDAANGK